MPYPCFLSKDNQVWLMVMPVIQSRRLMLDQTFSLSPTRSQSMKSFDSVHFDILSLQGLQKFWTTLYLWCLCRPGEIWIIQQPSDYSGQAPSSLWPFLTPQSRQRLMWRMKQVGESLLNFWQWETQFMARLSVFAQTCENCNFYLEPWHTSPF